MSRSDIPFDGVPDSWWSQDENFQRGLPSPEDCPQEGAFDEGVPEEIIERFAQAQRAADERQRAEERIHEQRRKQILALIRDRNRPPSWRLISSYLERVMRSEDARAVAVARSAGEQLARVVSTTGDARLPHVQALLARLANAPYESSGIDRELLEAARHASRMLFLSHATDNPADGAPDVGR